MPDSPEHEGPTCAVPQAAKEEYGNKIRVAAQRAAPAAAEWNVEVVAEPVGKRNVPVGSSRVDLQACKLEYSIVSPK